MNDIICEGSFSICTGLNGQNSFEGTLEGNMHTISGIDVSSISDNTGFIGSLGATGIIKNLNLKIIKIVGGHDRTGGLVGLNLGEIISCSVIGQEGGTGIKGNYMHTGGLVGYNLGKIKQSYAEINVEGFHENVGGLVGYNKGEIENSYAKGNAKSLTDNSVGGLAGTHESGIITKSYSTGNAIGNERIGGLVGRMLGGEIKNSFSTGQPQGNIDVNGTVGKIYGGTITDSFHHYNYGERPRYESDYTAFFSSSHKVYTIGSLWDFTNIWGINEGIGYPYLRWLNNKCGDGVCEEKEDCSICPQDCPCGANSYCLGGECISQYSCSGTSAYQITGVETCSDVYYIPNYLFCLGGSDGNVDTDYASGYTTLYPKWIYGDLGEVKCVSAVRIQQRAQAGYDPYGPQKMNIQISNDGIYWQNVAKDWQVDQYNVWVTKTFSEKPARYVRFLFSYCGGQHSCHLKEFQINARNSACIPDCTIRECGSDGCSGSCGTCINPHGTTSCNNGLCNPICSQGWGNCDRNNANGCETDLTTSNNCGTCGNICRESETCENGFCVAEVYWANMKFEPITEAQIGDSVLMIYEQGVKNQFEIKEKDLLIDDNIKTGQNAIVGKIINNKLTGKWIITQEDYDLGDDGDNEAEFFFAINGLTSEILTVQKNSFSDAPPIIQLIKPTANQKFKIQTSIDFELIAKDEDDDLKVTWNFGDGTSETLTNCLTTTNCNTTHSYLNSGTEIIILTAEEMTRTQKAEDNTRIFTYKTGINLFPLITEPIFGAVFPTQLINFNAKDSNVSECSPISCPGASCYNVDDLKCYDFSKDDIPSVYNLWFNWTFSEGLGLSGKWSPDYDKAVVFTKTFFQPTKQWAKLILGYQPISQDIQWSEDTKTEFEISSVQPQCFAEDETSYWKYWDAVSGTLVTEQITDGAENCYKPTGQPTTCCPNNKGECNIISGICQGLTHPLYCEGYNAERYGGDLNKAETACNNFHIETAKRSVDKMAGKDDYCGSTQSRYDSSTGKTCWWLITNCRCQWDDIDDVCEPAFSTSSSSCLTGPPSSDIGTCTFETVSHTGDCNAGSDIETYTWDAIWDGAPEDKPVECVSETRNFACEQIIKMPFFTSMNFIITLVIMTLIYTILIIKNKIIRRHKKQQSYQLIRSNREQQDCLDV